VVDIAGSGPVHLLGGVSALAAGIMLGPRLHRYDKGATPPQMGNPVNACVGLFFLWWGWLAFNSGSTYGLSGAKWEYAARSAFMTILASFGGGMYSLIHSMARNKGKLDPSDLINGILGSLVGITGEFILAMLQTRFFLFPFYLLIKFRFNFPAGCFLFRAWESILVGIIGSILTLFSVPLFDKMRIDDPVGELEDFARIK
jgi:ammonium transporter, Amt family